MDKGNVLRVRSNKLGLLLGSFLLVGIWTGCTENGHRTIDPAPLEHKLDIGRLDQQLFNAKLESLPDLNAQLYREHGTFYRIYIEDILQGAALNDPRLPRVLADFISDPDWSAAQQAVDSVLGDLEPQRVQFQDAFGRLKTLFPDSITPSVIAFNSGFNFGIFPTDSVLGVGVEWFIGSDNPVIGLLTPDAFPQFMKDRMIPEMLVPSALKGWLLVHYTKDIRGEDLLTNLVETGKVMAILDVLLPNTDPELKFAFSKEQLAWCEANEFEIWKNLVSDEKLFSKQADDIGRMMNDGPFTNGLPRESPGHIGEWIGYRMVTAYLKENPDASFAQLIAIEDPKVILRSYKPK